MKKAIHKVWFALGMPPAILEIFALLLFLPGAPSAMWRIATKKKSRKNFLKGYRGK